VNTGTDVTTAATSSGRAALVAASVVAGALAVPPHPVATPLCAAGFGLFALFGLFVWRWSRLPLVRLAPSGGISRLVRPAICIAAGLGVGLLILAVMRIVIAEIAGAPCPGSHRHARGLRCRAPADPNDIRGRRRLRPGVDAVDGGGLDRPGAGGTQAARMITGGTSIWSSR